MITFISLHTLSFLLLVFFFVSIVSSSLPSLQYQDSKYFSLSSNVCNQGSLWAENRGKQSRMLFVLVPLLSICLLIYVHLSIFLYFHAYA